LLTLLSKEGHGNSTVRTTKNGARVISDDDYHIPLRMGTGENWCNLHGHFYLVYEDDDPSKKAIRMMEERERGIRGGKNPHLWTWGGLPPGYASPNIKYPETPYEIVPNSILDKRFSRQAGGSKGVKT
jgi:hypothetical protein